MTGRKRYPGFSLPFSRQRAIRLIEITATFRVRLRLAALLCPSEFSRHSIRPIQRTLRPAPTGKA